VARDESAFEHRTYYRGPDDAKIDEAIRASHTGIPQLSETSALFGVLLENHNLVTQDESANQLVLDDLQAWIYE